MASAPCCSYVARRKLELVAAACCDVPLVVADELAEGIDVPSMYVFEKVIKDGVRNGKRFIVSSHNMGFLTDVCNTLAIIDHGRCVDMLDLSDRTPDVRTRVLKAFECLPGVTDEGRS